MATFPIARLYYSPPSYSSALGSTRLGISDVLPKAVSGWLTFNSCQACMRSRVLCVLHPLNMSEKKRDTSNQSVYGTGKCVGQKKKKKNTDGFLEFPLSLGRMVKTEDFHSCCSGRGMLNMAAQRDGAWGLWRNRNHVRKLKEGGLLAIPDLKFS